MPVKGVSEAFPWEPGYHTEFMASGTGALSLAVALAVRRKRPVSPPEVIIPAYGCPDLVAAIVAQGAKPVLVDLDPDLPFMSIAGLRRAITPSTVAVVGVGFLGIPERLGRLRHLCDKQRVVLIEDSAQCFPPASAKTMDADFVVLSFGRGKPINLMGGGALLIKRRLLEHGENTMERYPQRELKIDVRWWARRWLFNLLLLRYPFSVIERLPFAGIGVTRFHALAQVLRLGLPRNLVQAGLEGFWSRPALHARYDEALNGLADKGWIMLSHTLRSDTLMPYERRQMLRYPVLAPDRDLCQQAVRALNDAGIGASRFYRLALNEIEGVSAYTGPGHYPNARDFADRLLTLPTHEDVQPTDVARVALVLQALPDAHVARFKDSSA